MFYEVSGLGSVDAFGYMHPFTTTSNNFQQEVICFTYMIHSLSLSCRVFVLPVDKKKVSISNIKREDHEGFMMQFNL